MLVQQILAHRLPWHCVSQQHRLAHLQRWTVRFEAITPTLTTVTVAEDVRWYVPRVQ